MIRLPFRGCSWWLRGVLWMSLALLLVFSLSLVPSHVSSKLNKVNKLIYDFVGDPVSELCWFQGTGKEISHNQSYAYNNSGCFVNKSKLEAKLSKGLPAWALAQIQGDLSKFETIHRADLDRYATDYNPLNILARFRIEQGFVKIILPVVPPNSSEAVRKEKEAFYALYRGFQSHPRFKAIYNMLQFMAKNGYIPDTEFVMGIQDVVSTPSAKPYPIFAFAKSLGASSEANLILMPDAVNLNSVTQLGASIREARSRYPWKDKQSLIFWRGGNNDSTGFRKKTVRLSEIYPSVIDAKFVLDSEPEKFVSPAAHLQYRYLLSIDGVRCSWARLIWLLDSNSLVLKHESDQVQWFYKGIKPYKHYVPIQSENDLFEKKKWADAHPEEVQKIITEANAFVEQNLSLEDMYHYMIVLLQEYNKKLKP